MLVMECSSLQHVALTDMCNMWCSAYSVTVYSTCILLPNSWAFKSGALLNTFGCDSLDNFCRYQPFRTRHWQPDIQVNQYPGRRDFKAIGSGGEDFKQTIVRAVEDVVGPVKEDRVVQRPSSQGKFISITLKDVKVQNPDQVC